MSTPSIRLFVSSPGDVDLERKTARRIVEALNGEYRGRFVLDAFFWEYEPVRQQQTFQNQIPDTAGFDALICILWSRLGTPLTGPDGKDYLSGTDYEVSSAREAYVKNNRPDLMVYWNRTPAQIRQLPRKDRERDLRQLERLEDFIHRNLVDQETGVVRGAYTSYRDLGQFEERLELHLRKLIEAKLSEQPPGQAANAPAAANPVTWHGRPYQGLRVFDFEHSPIFFGRTRAVGEVLALLRRRAARLEEARAAAIEGATEEIDPAAAAFVLVCAMSGVGKSSLVRAGVLPLLVEPGGGIGLWRRAVLRPSEKPLRGDLFDALAQELTKPAGLPELLGGGVTVPELAYMLRRNPTGIELLLKQALGQAAEMARLAEDRRLAEEVRVCHVAGRTEDVRRVESLREGLRPVPARLAVVIDQMEELFTVADISAAMRRGFLQALAALARSGVACVLGTLRSDFFGRCMEVPELMELKADGLYDLQPPTPAELGQMIRRPAAAAGLVFERRPDSDVTLDESLRDAALGQPEALPLLEFALDQLYDRRTPQGRLTWQAYDEIGGLGGALATAAEAALTALAPWRQETFDHVIGSVVTLAAAPHGTAHRRGADYATLTAPPGAREFVERFIAARLFIVDRDTAGRSLVTVSHEALLSRRAVSADGVNQEGGAAPRRPWLWERLGEWVEANADFLRMRARTAASLQQWQEAGQEPGFLLQAGRPLLDGQALLAHRRDNLSSEERDFIGRSVEAEARRAAEERRRQQEVEQALRRAEEANRNLGSQLRQASLSDLNTARELSAKGSGREALAYLGRSLKYDPQNRLAAHWFWQEVVYGEENRERRPFRFMTCERSASNTVFNPNGSPMLAVLADHVYLWDYETSATARVLEYGSHAQDVVFSPDGTRLIVPYGDGTARFWDAATGRQIGAPMPHGVPVQCAAFSPDGSRVATGCRRDGFKGGFVQIWESGTGRPLSEPMPHDGGVRSVAFSPDGTLIVSASLDRTARLWNSADGRAVGEPWQHRSRVNGAFFSPDGTCVLTATAVSSESGSEVRFWDVATGRLIGEPWRHNDTRPMRVAGFSPDGTRVAFVCPNWTARLWDVATGQLTGEPWKHGDKVHDAAFSPDGTWVATASADGTAQLWDAATGRTAGAPLRHDASVNAVAFHPAGTQLATAGHDGSVRVWNLALPQSLGQPLDLAYAAVVDPAGTRIAAFYESDVKFYDAATGRPIGGPRRHGGKVRQMVFCPDGTQLAVACENETVAFLDGVTGEALREPMSFGGQVSHFAYNPNGRGFAVVREVDHTVWLNQIPGEAVLDRPLRHDNKVTALAFSPDGARLLTLSLPADEKSNPKLVRVWDAATGQPLGEPIRYEHEINSAVFSPDGRYLLLTHGIVPEAKGEVRRWDAFTGLAVGEPISLPGVVHDAVFSPDGRWIVAASEASFGKAGEVRRWDAATLQPQGASIPYEVPVTKLIFSPDGRQFATVCKKIWDKPWGQTRLWDAATMQPLRSPWHDGMKPSEVVFVPGGTRMLGHADCLWEMPPPDLPEPPAWLGDLASALSGLLFDEASGGFQSLASAKQYHLAAALTGRLGTAAADERSGWKSLARWALMPTAASRPLTPGTTFTNAELADNHLSTEDPGMWRARLLDPAHPLLMLYYANQGQELARLAYQDLPGYKKAIADLTNRFASTRPGEKTREDYEHVGQENRKITSDFAEACLASPAHAQSVVRANFQRVYALKHMPADPALWRRAATELEKNCPAVAAVLLEKVLAAAPAPDARLLIRIIVNHWRGSRKDDAVRGFQRLLALDRTYADTEHGSVRTEGEATRKILSEVLTATLLRHPELAAQKDPRT